MVFRLNEAQWMDISVKITHPKWHCLSTLILFSDWGGLIFSLKFTKWLIWNFTLDLLQIWSVFPKFPKNHVFWWYGCLLENENNQSRFFCCETLTIGLVKTMTFKKISLSHVFGKYEIFKRGDWKIRFFYSRDPLVSNLVQKEKLAQLILKFSSTIIKPFSFE